MKNIKMTEIMKFLKENASGYLAAVDNGIPRVRPFGFILEEDGKLYFCTNSLKHVYKQLLEVSLVEYAVTSKEMVTVRISGEIFFCEDIKTKEKVLNVYDSIKSGYKTAENPIFKVFYMEHGTANVSDFSGQPPKIVSF